jgi:hypothetical protein
LKDDLLARVGSPLTEEGFLTVKGAGFRLIDEAITEQVAIINYSVLLCLISSLSASCALLLAGLFPIKYLLPGY